MLNTETKITITGKELIRLKNKNIITEEEIRQLLAIYREERDEQEVDKKEDK